MDSSLNYGGNIEVIPPQQYGQNVLPLGRLVIGGGEAGTLFGQPTSHEHMANGQLAWLDSQDVQGPTIELSTEWLAVGHVDEYFLFIRNPNETHGRPWQVVISSPDLARQALQALSDQGHGNLVVFQGRAAETTVSAILGDASLMTFNSLAQARIDSERERINDLVGLTDADIVEVPVLYEDVYGRLGEHLALAFNPDVTNLAPVGEVLFVPDPMTELSMAMSRKIPG